MNKILTLLFLLLANISFAQQESMFTHYMYNTLAVNPAYAGTRDALTVTGLHRSQWVGFDGAPSTQTLTLHSPIFIDNFGLGLSVINDKIGPTQHTAVFADFAYQLKITESSKLSIGLKAGFNHFAANLNDLSIKEASDVMYQSNIDSKLMPNFGFGLYYHSDKFYVGLSTPRMLENELFDVVSNTSSTIKALEYRHYYFIAGAILNLNHNVKLRPSTLVKMTHGAPLSVDVTANFIFSEKYIAGLKWRSEHAAGILLGYNITNQLMIGYSFDWSFLNETAKYNWGSHEIMFRYDFLFDKGKVRSPRYF